MKAAARSATTASRGIHPMFVELFMSPDDDDPQAGSKRRPARRARRVRTRSSPAGNTRRPG